MDKKFDFVQITFWLDHAFEKFY